MDRAILFPGQGAQYVGMGKPFWDRFPEAREVYACADDALGLNLSGVCFEGPEDRLSATDICQPAILTTSMAIVKVLETRCGLRPEQFRAAAGLSLGEYSALCFAGVLTLADAVRLVRNRGLYMQEASDLSPSGMLTLIGCRPEAVDALVAKAAEAGVIVAANFLAPGQIALSGSNEAIDCAEQHAREHGIRRCVRLKVAGAFHSPLMKPAAERLRHEVDETTFAAPAIPVFSNVTGEAAASPEQVRELLVRQLLSPVLWEGSMRRMEAMGVTGFLEPGPGRVLSGLARKCVRGSDCVNVDSPDDLGGTMGGSQPGASPEAGDRPEPDSREVGR